MFQFWNGQFDINYMLCITFDPYSTYVHVIGYFSYETNIHYGIIKDALIGLTSL